MKRFEIIGTICLSILLWDALKSGYTTQPFWLIAVNIFIAFCGLLYLAFIIIASFFKINEDCKKTKKK